MARLFGSSVSMREGACLFRGGPLYGRRTGRIKLNPIPFSRDGNFFPGKGLRELMELYAVAGGISGYIEFLGNGEGSLYEKIQRNIGSPPP